MIDHRSHEYPHLIRRWRAVARAAGGRLEPFAVAGGFELFHFRSPALRPDGGIYISAGIHGDEPGSTEGLLAWAEKHVAELRAWPVQLFPCLNPWGLSRNIRCNEQGLDLNRAFARRGVPEIRGLQAVVRGYRFTAALHLHEDYDGQGVYLYEVRGPQPYWGETLLEAARPIIPIDARFRIDGRISRTGVIRRRFDTPHLRSIGGLPEALYLCRRGTRRTITFETPSEFALGQRIQTQVAVIEKYLELARPTPT